MLLNITDTHNPHIFRNSFYQYMSTHSNLDSVSKKENTFRILSFNIYQWMNSIHQPNFNNQLDVIAQLDPDVFILQEAVFNNSVPDNDHHINRFIQLGYSHYIYSKDTPVDNNSNLSYGNILFSKIPFINHRIIDTSINNSNNENYSCLYVELPNDIHIFGTHLEVHDPTDNSRIIQLEKIYQVINTIHSPNIILLGDLNLLYQPHLTPQQWDYQVLHDKNRNIITTSKAHQTITNNHFTDSFDFLHKIPPIISCCYDRRVDYIFIKNTFHHYCDNTQIVNTNVSDHLPIYLDLIITK